MKIYKKLLFFIIFIITLNGCERKFDKLVTIEVIYNNNRPNDTITCLISNHTKEFSPFDGTPEFCIMDTTSNNITALIDVKRINILKQYVNK